MPSLDYVIGNSGTLRDESFLKVSLRSFVLRGNQTSRCKRQQGTE